MRRPSPGAAADALLAGALAIAAAAEARSTADAGAGTALLAGILVLPVAARRAAPLPVLVWLVVAVAIQRLNTEASGATALFLALVLVMYTTGRELGGDRSLAAAVLGAIAVGINFVGASPDAAGMLFSLATLEGAWWTGRVARERDITRVREAHSREREQAAVDAERARIARELHDVVAHSVSLMVVQAGAAAEVLDRDPVAARRALGAVQTAGRGALAELQRMLGLLRESGPATTAPAPRLAEVDELIRQARAVGVDAVLSVEGPTTGLPPGVELCAYRLVQEGLTNVIRHAGPARCHVTVRRTTGSLLVEVIDDGRGTDVVDGAGGGHGLVGMRERVALYGGELEAAPVPERGFAVRARLPLGATT